jgi:Zn-dependent protease with chaperone function
VINTTRLLGSFRVVSVALVTGSLIGCATMHPSVPAVVGRAPTPDEQRVIEAFAPRVIAAARHEGLTCPDVRFVMKEMPNNDLRVTATPSSNVCTFFVQVNPRVLAHDSPAELGGTLAHELGHVVNRDWTPERASVPQIERERQADGVAIRILKRLGRPECAAHAEHFRQVRADNVRAWGAEQRHTVGTHPSYTERIRRFETECAL